ncbi:MAG: acyltransferase [Candidatus Nanopelagicales bacterium]
MQVVQRWDIHLLRAVAILSVFAYHTGVPHAGGGSLGVDVFFVLSGYLITSALLRSNDRRSFYRKRLARTVPAAVVTALVVTAVALVVAPGDREQMVWHLGASLTWTENILVTLVSAGDLGGVMSLTPYTHFWSLAMEEQFYLVWPWVIAGIVAVALRRRTLALSAVLVGVIGVSLTLYWAWAASNHAVAYFSPLTRVWQLAAGALVAVWLPRMTERFPRHRALPAVGLALFPIGVAVLVVCVTFGGFAHDTDSPWWGVTVVATTAVLLATGRWLKPLPPAFMRVLVPLWLVGTLSYGLYLWHLPVLWTLVHLGMPEHTAVWWGVVLVLSFGAAALSWRFVEQPSIAWARRASRPAPAPVSQDRPLVPSA